MRVLLVESTPGNGAAAKEWLETAGHETTTCFEPPVGLGCRGVDHHEDCPLERHTDMALVVRDLDGGARSLTEMGAVCAMRHRVPVVEITESGTADLDVAMLSALADAHEAHTAPYVDAIRRAFASVGRLSDPDAVGVTVTRSPDRVHAMLAFPADFPGEQVPMVVDWASRALRDHDRYVKIIDVGVTR